MCSNMGEGKGRSKSWTLRDRLREGVMGQGLAAPPPPTPGPPLGSQRDGTAEAPRSCIFPLCPPMAPTRAPRAPCGRRVGARPLRGHLLIAPAPPLGGARCAHPSHPKDRVPSRTPCHWHKLRMPLEVPGAALPHRPMHDLHTGALCASQRDCMGHRCPTLLDPARWAGSGRGRRGVGGGSLLKGFLVRRRLVPLRTCPCHVRAPPTS